MKKILLAFAAGVLLLVSTTLIAATKPAPSHTVSLKVVNHCGSPMTVHVDNNIGSQQTGDYQIATNVSQGFILNSNNDEEYYTFTYRNATCKVDYSLIQDRWFLDAIFSNCDSLTRCDLQ